MKEAFERAGVKPAADRLIEIAIAARKEHPRDFSRSRDMVYAAVSSDAALLWELFKPYRMQAVQNLISSVRLESNRMEGREGAMVVVPAVPVKNAQPPAKNGRRRTFRSARTLTRAKSLRLKRWRRCAVAGCWNRSESTDGRLAI